MDCFQCLISLAFSLCNIIAQTDYTQHTAAVGYNFAFFIRCSTGMENFTSLIGLIQAEDHIAFFWRIRIILCSQHYAYCSLRIPFGRNTIQFAVDCRFNQVH